MSDSPFIQAMQAILSGAWKLITSVKYPGTEISIAVIMVGAFLAVFSIRIIAHVLSMSVGVGSVTLKSEKSADKIKAGKK